MLIPPLPIFLELHAANVPLDTNATTIFAMHLEQVLELELELELELHQMHHALFLLLLLLLLPLWSF